MTFFARFCNFTQISGFLAEIGVFRCFALYYIDFEPFCTILGYSAILAQKRHFWVDFIVFARKWPKMGFFAGIGIFTQITRFWAKISVFHGFRLYYIDFEEFW